MILRKPLSCIIIDDEDGAHLVIEHHLKGLECLKLCGNFFGAKEAMDYIYKNPVDLIFLDINMPGISGLEMLAAMMRPPLVILTTAYSEFALESYEYQVVDYLVKPIGVSRFLASIDKVIARFQPQGINTDEELITLKVDGEYLRINPQDIDYIQSWGNYVKVFMNGHFVLASTSTCELEKKLDPSRFMRIHKSYIVALNHIQKIKGTHVHLLDEIILPIGNTHRKQLLERLK